MKLWLDDTRNPPDNTWTIARTADEAIALLREHCCTEASLDHDLGHCAACEGCNGYQSSCGCRCHLSGTFVVNWMASENVWPDTVHVHSCNCVGAKNMVATLNRYGPYENKVVWTPAFYSVEQLEKKRGK